MVNVFISFWAGLIDEVKHFKASSACKNSRIPINKLPIDSKEEEKQNGKNIEIFDCINPIPSIALKLNYSFLFIFSHQKMQKEKKIGWKTMKLTTGIFSFNKNMQ